MNYITIKEVANKWGVSTRAVTYHVVAGRIEGAIKRGNLWLIPQDVDKPSDARRKNRSMPNEKKPEVHTDTRAIYEQRTHKTQWPFHSLYENKELFVEMIRYFPYPIHICAPDGTMLLANDAFLRFSQISNPEKLYHQHNVLLIPDLERWGLKDFVLRAFHGETVQACDIRVPYHEIIEKYADNKEPPSESIFQNMTAFPIRDDEGELLYVVTLFITSRYYQDREEIMRGKEYIDDHWKDEFDIDKLAGAVHISRYHYTRLFKQHTGMTPYNYYQDIKVGKLMEMLCDNNLSVAQAFAECGVDFNGSFTKVFKEKTGMTPSQYRKSMREK